MLKWLLSKGGHMKTKSKTRNMDAIAPIMNKGGVHQKSNKASRHNEKMKLKRNMQKEAANWQPYLFLAAA